MNTVIIGIGSNINAARNIKSMLQLLEQNVKVVRVSALKITKPIGITNQPDFTNGAVKIETDLQLPQLKKLLKSIEDQMGRDRSGPKFGPRCIDLDITVWNNKIIDDDYFTRDFLKNSVDEIW